jgi:hypothetical protein
MAADGYKLPPLVGVGLDQDALRALIRQLVVEVVDEMERHRADLGDQLAYSEEQAARAIGLNPHQLRDERKQGRIRPTYFGLRNRPFYCKACLLEYLASHPYNLARQD